MSAVGAARRVNPIADDGDEVTFCSTCAFSSACLAEGYDKGMLVELHCLVEHVGDRKSVVEGKSVSVRVDLGGRRIIKKKKGEKLHFDTQHISIYQCTRITLTPHQSMHQ